MNASRATWATIAAIAAIAAMAGVGLLFVRFSSEPRTPRSDEPAPQFTRPAPTAGAEGARARPATEPRASSERGHEAPEGLPFTQLPLRLLETAIDPVSGFAMATLRDEDVPELQVLAEGQPLKERPEVEIHRIETEQVLLANHGMLERLLLDPEAARDHARQKAEQGIARDRFVLTEDERDRRRELAGRLAAITEAGDDYRAVADAERREGLLAEVDAEALYDEEGALVGVELHEIEPGGVFDRAGLESGDVVRSVGDIEIGGPMAAAMLLEDIVSRDTIDVVVEREGGRMETVPISTEDLLNDLAELAREMAEEQAP